MALNRENLLALAKANAKATLNPSTTFSVEGQELSKSAISTKFVDELNQLGKNPHDYARNKELIYELLEVGITEVMPTKVLQNYGQFADVQTFAQGTKPIFKLKVSDASKRRAKSFVTRVGLAGRYETFKLDGYQFEVPTSAYGGASRVEWEEMLDGSFSMNDYYSLVLEGMDEAVYKEIANALESMIVNVPTINKTAQTTFDESKMDHLLWTADAYGKSTIYCTFEFASTMLPQGVGGATNWDAMSGTMKEQIWNNGYFANYKGHNVIILPQSFTDNTNAEKMINPAHAYIIPTGAEKPVKVAFEGSAQVKSFDNRDWSTEIQTYQKLGVATYLVNPGICVYTNSSLVKSNAWTN